MEKESAGTGPGLREQLQAALGGAYTIERELGGGGMARVFLAEEPALGRHVVVKVLAPELTEGLSAERFAREVRLAARLQHPNIVPVLAAGERDGLAYYTMPFVAGESLRARLAREGRLPVDAAVSVLRDVARALEYAHAEGVVHRDVKPDNVLLARSPSTGSGQAAAVADFGIAKALDVARTAATARDAAATGGAERVAAETLTRAGTSLGTPAYMSPEQAAGDPDVDARADVYAWGVVAYELLAGAPPFAGRAPHQLIAAHIGEPPPPLSDRAPGVPPALASLVMRCLEKNPALRPQSAGELLSALEAVRTVSGERAAERARVPRTRMLLAIGVVAASLVAIVAVVVFRARPPAAPTSPVLAVLPFENLGPPGDAYFADGLTEEIRARLAGLSGLQVIGGRSSRLYKGSTKRPREIARELGATHLLTGTVRWERAPNGGGRVRVSPELVRAADQASVWAETVDGGFDDVFAMQARVAERVATSLDVTLLAHERQAVAARPTADTGAHDAYLRGLAASTRASLMNPAGQEAAAAEFERAVALDPSFAAAHARLADMYAWKYGSFAEPELLEKVRASAARAWALDSTLVESRVAWAAYLAAARDLEGARRVLVTAAAAAPANAEVLSRLAELEGWLGHPERGIASAQRAAALDPRAPEPWAHLAALNDYQSHYEEAIQSREREIALSPDNMGAYMWQAKSYLLWRADTATARRMFERGGPALETGWLVWGPSAMATGAPVLWERLLSPATLHARDTITRAGYAARASVLGAEYFHLMKARHFAFTGRPERARAHAESLVALIEPRLGHERDAWLTASLHTRRSILAEAYARVGRAADAAREADRHVAAVRRDPDLSKLTIALVGAAYVDVLIGRRDTAVARLAEALGPPVNHVDVQRPISGDRISRALLRADSAWAPLRGHPGFERLLAGN